MRSVAIYQPKQALRFVERKIEGGNPPRELSQIIRNIGYSYDYLDEACELLWELGRHDQRPLGQNPSHPIRVLSELCGFEENKPLEFVQKVFDYGMGLLDRPDAWDSYYTPLHVLSPILSGEGISTTSTGHAFVMSSFTINYEVAAPMRRRFIDRLLELVRPPKSTDWTTSGNGAAEALRRPWASWGARCTPEDHEQYQENSLKRSGPWSRSLRPARFTQLSHSA